MKIEKEAGEKSRGREREREKQGEAEEGTPALEWKNPFRTGRDKSEVIFIVRSVALVLFL